MVCHFHIALVRRPDQGSVPVHVHRIHLDFHFFNQLIVFILFFPPQCQVAFSLFHFFKQLIIFIRFYLNARLLQQDLNDVRLVEVSRPDESAVPGDNNNNNNDKDNHNNDNDNNNR